MKIKFLFLALTLVLISSCNKQEKLMVKDLLDNDVNILASKNEKIIVVSNGMVCHECVMNLNDFIAKHYNLTKYDFYILYEDPIQIPARRWTILTYKNQYTPDVKKIFFCVQDSNIKQKLNIVGDMYQQLTPYIIYIDKDKNAKYIPFEAIFNPGRTGTVKKSFRIK